MLEHSIGDLAIHFVTWILGGRNLLIHYRGLVTLDAVTSRPCRDSLLEGQLIARFQVTSWITAPEFRAMG